VIIHIDILPHVQYLLPLHMVSIANVPYLVNLKYINIFVYVF
jgi:hypothetical protein